MSDEIWRYKIGEIDPRPIRVFSCGNTRSIDEPTLTMYLCERISAGKRVDCCLAQRNDSSAFILAYSTGL